jgi:hypothetical protein
MTYLSQINMAADTHLLILVSASLLIGPPYLAWVECSRGGDGGSGGSGSYHDVAFIESPQYSVALPGDSVYFNCRTNLPASLENITWLHNGKPLPWKSTTGGMFKQKNYNFSGRITNSSDTT